MTDDPYLRMSDHQRQDLRELYEPADPLGWPARAAIAAAALVLGAAVGAVVTCGGVFRRLLAP